MIYYTEPEGQKLRDAFEERVLQWPKVATRRMYGCPAYLADGKLFAFLVTDGVVITQIRKRDREAIAEAYETKPFEAGEREITRWLQVTIDDLSRLDRIVLLVRKSYETVLTY